MPLLNRNSVNRDVKVSVVNAKNVLAVLSRSVTRTLILLNVSSKLLHCLPALTDDVCLWRITTIYQFSYFYSFFLSKRKAQFIDHSCGKFSFSNMVKILKILEYWFKIKYIYNERPIFMCHLGIFNCEPNNSPN